MSSKTTWVIDPIHSEIGFRVKHLMISYVKGQFVNFQGQVTTDGDDFSTSEIQFIIDVASISTKSEDRDGHLKSPDFFDVEKFTEISFTSGRLIALNQDEYSLAGNLVIKGISKPVTLKVEFGGLMTDPWGNVKAGFTIDGKINRKDFGLLWNAALEAGGVLVGDEVIIHGEMQLAKQKA